MRRIPIGLAGFGFFCAVAAGVAAGGGRPPAPEIQVLSREVIVEGVSGFPKLALSPDGELFASIFNQAGHGERPGDIVCYASADGGRTWMFRGNATGRGEESGFLTHALGVTPEGTVVIIASRWVYAARPEGGHSRGAHLSPVVSRSSDGGRTWTITESFPDAPDGQRLVPFGRIREGNRGELWVSAYSYNRRVTPRVDTSYLLVSEDDGLTWKVHAVIGPTEASETDLLRLDGKSWLAAARNLGDETRQGHSIDIYASDDAGAGWRRVTRPTASGQFPAALTDLGGGRVLLTFADRRGPDFGVFAAVGTPAGHSWSRPVMLTRDVLSGDCGYPSTVQLPDGTIVTIYYAAEAVGIPKYHVGIVRWVLPQ